MSKKPCAVCGAPCGGLCCIGCRGTYTIQKHTSRIKEEFGEPAYDVIYRLYCVEKLGTPEICKRLGFQFRTLKATLAHFNIRPRTPSEGVATQWYRDDGSRRKAQGERIARIGRTLKGDKNPAKRPEVGRKISAYKKMHNPMHNPATIEKMRQTKTGPKAPVVCLCCGKVFILPEGTAKRRSFCSRACYSKYQTSPLEVAMMGALNRYNLHYVWQHKVLRYFIDFALVECKVAIECDGEGWHDPIRDAIRDEKLARLGWLTLRYTGSEIHAGVDACVEDVLSNLEMLNIKPPMIG